MANSDRVWLVDASIYVFRAWFTVPVTTNPEGKNINAVLGFRRFVDTLLEREQPRYLAFAFDESLQTSHRKEIFPLYKANRESAPENLRYQFRLCRQYLRAIGVVEAASRHYEADDLIATWAAQSNKPVNVITADKDLAQIIGQHDLWWDYQKGNSLGYKQIIKKFGVRPDQIADQLAMAGDKADNIPGVPGIGMATAANLLRRFDSLDQLLDSIEQIGHMKFRGAARIKQLVKGHQGQIGLFRQLTGVFDEVPDLPGAFEITGTNRQELKAFITSLGADHF